MTTTSSYWYKKLSVCGVVVHRAERIDRVCLEEGFWCERCATVSDYPECKPGIKSPQVAYPGRCKNITRRAESTLSLPSPVSGGGADQEERGAREDKNKAAERSGAELSGVEWSCCGGRVWFGFQCRAAHSLTL